METCKSKYTMRLQEKMLQNGVNQKTTSHQESGKWSGNRSEKLNIFKFIELYSIDHACFLVVD